MRASITLYPLPFCGRIRVSSLLNLKALIRCIITVINEDVYLELLELLELYCELLIARFGLLDQRCVRADLMIIYTYEVGLKLSRA